MIEGVTKQEIDMHYNLWFNDALVEGIEGIMKKTGKKRNTVVREAVEKYIKDWNNSSWPESIQNFEGIKGFNSEDRFENFRNNLKEPKKNIFEG